MRQAVFFDRDGTLMEERGYCGDPSGVHLYPGVSEALRSLKEAGFLNVIVSNQSGIGRGLFTEEAYHAVQAELLRQIGGGLIDASYFCPDVPGALSTRRKPEPGMLLEAAREFGIDLARSALVGDKASDIECAHRAGAHAVLVTTGYGASQTCAAEFRAAGITAAAGWILRNLAQPPLAVRM
jgi:D-glycero-D-manno-heptose 1,7-bisphosphate phosphatase